MIKLLDILNELNVNKPLSSLYDIVDMKGNGWWSLEPKNPENYLRDLKRVCLISSSKYGKYLDDIYKKGTYCIMDEADINNVNSDRFGKVNYNRIIKILNHLKIDYSNAKILYGMKFYEKWDKNINSYNDRYINLAHWITVFILDDIMFFTKGTGTYVLTPSKKIVKISDINLDNAKDKRTIKRKVNTKTPTWKSRCIAYDVDEQNNIIKFNYYIEDKILGKGEVLYKNKVKEANRKETLLKNCKVSFQSTILDIEDFNINVKEINFYNYETTWRQNNELGGMWGLDDKITKLLADKERIAQNIQPVDNEEEIRKWINELNINKPVSFWDMVKEMIIWDVGYAEALLNNWYNTFEDYTDQFGLNYDGVNIEKYQYFYDYFSKISPSQISPKINFRTFSRNMSKINEGLSYKFIEIWYIGDGDFGLALHNNNKIFLKDE